MTGGAVLVLGSTGRNFAAGMSGGVAYVLDDTGDFERRCNKETVDLEPVVSSATDDALTGDIDALAGLPASLIMEDPRTDDARRVMWLLARHRRFTGSNRAAEILADWARHKDKFVKVMPREYRRALTELRAAAAAETVVAGGR